MNSNRRHHHADASCHVDSMSTGHPKKYGVLTLYLVSLLSSHHFSGNWYIPKSNDGVSIDVNNWNPVRLFNTSPREAASVSDSDETWTIKLSAVPYEDVAESSTTSVLTGPTSSLTTGPRRRKPVPSMRISANAVAPVSRRRPT